MISDNNSFLDFPPPLSTANKENEGYSQPLIMAENSDRNPNDIDKYNTQVATIGQFFSQDQIIKKITATSQNKLADAQNENNANDINNTKSQRNVSAAGQHRGPTIVIGSNQSSQNNLVSPSNTLLIKESDQAIQLAEQNSGVENMTLSKQIIRNKQQSDIFNKKINSNQEEQQLQYVNYNNSQSFRTQNTGADKLLMKSQKSKNSSQVMPSLFQHKLTKMSTMTPEKNLEQNLTKMVKLVKLKKKIAEVKRFFLKSSFYKQFVQQAEGHFTRVIDDPSCSMLEELPQGKILINYFLNTKFILHLSKCFKSVPTIEPSSKFKLVWDLLVGIVFMIYFFFIPVHVAINVSLHNLITQFLGYVLHIFMFVDILFSMNTGCFEKGVNISDKKKILLYYVKNYFWGDIISQIPLLVSELGDQDSQVEKIFVICFFVKLRNFQKIFRKFEDSFHLSPRTSNIISLIKLILTILFFSHIFACVWLFVGKLQYNHQTNWLKKIDMEDDSWTMQYIAAYYFSTVTMITVGYGDISPMNNLERLVCVGTMLISCVIFAYTINQIGTIFADLFSQDRQMKEFFYIINDYMDTKNIGFSLQYKIREYLDYYWREQDQNKSDLEKKIIDSLSDQLREKLMIEANTIILKNSGIFSMNFNQSVILKMIPIIQTLHTTPNQVIFSEGQLDDDMFIYFVEKGKVEVCREYLTESDDKDSEKIAKGVIALGPGSCFGAWSFFTNQERREMVRSLEFSKLLMIKRSEFIELIIDSPSEMEKFNMMKDTIIFEKNLEFLEVKCQCCMSYNHEIQHCHYFHFSPDKYVVVKKDNLKFAFQIRDEQFGRKRILQFKNLTSGKEAIQSVTDWKSQNIEPVEQYYQQYLQQYYDLFDQYDDNITDQDDQSDEDYTEESSESNEDDEDDEDLSNKDEENYTNEGEQAQNRNHQSSSSSFSSQNDNAKQNKSNSKEQNRSAHKQKDNNDSDGESQTHKRTALQMNMEKINEELNMSIKNSDDVEDESNFKDSLSPKEQRIMNNNYTNTIQNKRQFSKLTELVELEESTPSNQIIYSDKGSNRRIYSNKIDRVIDPLGKDSKNQQKEDQMVISNFSYKNYADKLPVSDQCIAVRKIEKSFSLMAQQQNQNELNEGNASTEIQSRRSQFKQLTVLTKKNSLETSKMIANAKKLPSQFDGQDQKSQKNTEFEQLSGQTGSLNDFSPQLIFIANDDDDDDDDDVGHFNQDINKSNRHFQLDSFQKFEDFNLNQNDNFEKEEEEEQIKVKSRSQIKGIKSQDQIKPRISNQTDDLPQAKIKMSKQKSVRIKETSINGSNEGVVATGLQRRNNSKRSQSQISISDTSEGIKFRKSNENIAMDKPKSQSKLRSSDKSLKRRKSNKIQGESIQISDEQIKLNQDSSLKKSKIHMTHNERKKQRNSFSYSHHNQPELTQKISTLTDTLLTENINQVSSCQQENKINQKRSSRVYDYEIQQQKNIYSPDIRRRQIPTLDKIRSQSFRSLEMYSGKPSNQFQLSQQQGQQQSQQKNININQYNQHIQSMQNRGNMGQSLQQTFQTQHQLQQQQQQYYQSNNNSPQTDKVNNSINNQIIQGKVMQKQEKTKGKIRQQKNILQDMIKFENNINNSSNSLNHHNNAIEQIQEIKRQDSSDSLQSNTSLTNNQNVQNKKKSAFSKEKPTKMMKQSSTHILQKQQSQTKPSQNFQSTQNHNMNSSNLQFSQQQSTPTPPSKMLSPQIPLYQYSINNVNNNNSINNNNNNNNSNTSYNQMQIPLAYPPSPLPSPNNRINESTKNKLINFINKTKQAQILSGSGINDSMSSHNKKSKGDPSPRSALSYKQMIVLSSNNTNNNNNFNQRMDGFEDYSIKLQKKNQNFQKFDDNSKIQRTRKQSTLSLNSVTSTNQIRPNNMLTINRIKQNNELPTPLLKVSQDKTNLFMQNSKIGGLKQQTIGMPHSLQQSQFFHNNKDRSPTNIDNIHTNIFQNTPQYMQQNTQGTQQFGNQLLIPNNNNNNNNQIPLSQQNTMQGYALFNYNESNQNNNCDLDQENNIFSIMDFEEIKFFQYYFPKGNHQRVIQKANIIISQNFVKFFKQLKKSKAQQLLKNRKLDEINNGNIRRGSYQQKKILNKKKSQVLIEIANTIKQQLGSGFGSDEKIEIRTRGNSLALGNHNLDDSQFSNDSDNTQHKLSQLGSPNLKTDANQTKINNDNIKSFPLVSLPQNIVTQSFMNDPKKLLSQTPKSIFNRQNQNN